MLFLGKQERGEIYFFFRPKVGIEEPHSSDDVQRLYLVLRPEFAEKVIEDKQSSDSGTYGLELLHYPRLLLYT